MKRPTLSDLKKYHKDIGSILMKPAMLNHPSTIWARQSIANFRWLYQHGKALCEEFEFRFDKSHGSYDRILEGMKIKYDLDYVFLTTGLTPVLLLWIMYIE